MNKKGFSGVTLTIIFAVLLCFLTQYEALAVGENNKGLHLLSTKYPPHEYEIVVVERTEEVTNENMIRSTFKGTGIATINFTGSFIGTIRIGGSITIGSMIFPGTINATSGMDTTKSISLSQNYTVKMVKPTTYILIARPIYEYCNFHIRKKVTQEIVEKGATERPIGLECTHYTQEEWDEEEANMVKKKQDHKKAVSLTELEGSEPKSADEEGEKHQCRQYKNSKALSVLQFLSMLGA
jgi:hypothetical protein